MGVRRSVALPRVSQLEALGHHVENLAESAEKRLWRLKVAEELGAGALSLLQRLHVGVRLQRFIHRPVVIKPNIAIGYDIAVADMGERAIMMGKVVCEDDCRLHLCTTRGRDWRGRGTSRSEAVCDFEDCSEIGLGAAQNQYQELTDQAGNVFPQLAAEIDDDVAMADTSGRVL